MAESLRGCISEADAYLGGVAGYRCSAGAHRRDAINGCQCLHRHLLTASSPTARKTAPSLAAFAVIVIFDCLYQDCHMQQRL